jgi:RHS repeat-associated protein
MVVKGSRRYDYDGENRLIRASDTKGSIIEQNRYDASGELIVKQDRNEKTVFIDGLYEEGKTHVSRHIRAGSLLVATVVTPRANVQLITQAHPSHDQPIYIAGVSGAGAGLLLLLIWLDGILGWRICRSLAGFSAACRAQPLSVALVFLVAFSPIAKEVYAGPTNETGAEKRYYYHANHLGSVNVVTDDDGKLTARRDYRPYGDPHDWTGANAGPREVLQTFQGQQFDDDTGLYNFKARYYDAELGRFTGADTVVADFNDPRTMNRYAFAGGNPIQFVDPSGRSFLSAVGDFFVNDVGLGDAVNWIEDNALEILTVVVIVVVVVLVVAAVVLTGGLALGGLAAVASFAALGGAAGFATFGGIALAQGNTVATGAFWIAAGTGAVLGALVGAAIPVAFAPATLFAGGITSFAGSVAAGALIGAATGGLEQAIACSTGCGGVENLVLPVAQGIVVGGVVGAISGGVASKFLQGSGFGTRVVRGLVNPGPISFSRKIAYATYSAAGGPLVRGKTEIEEVFRLVKIGGNELAQSAQNLPDYVVSPDARYGQAYRGDLTTAPVTP